MTSKFYFGRPSIDDSPLDGLYDASAVLNALSVLIGDSEDLSNFQRCGDNRAIEGMVIIIDSARHAIDTATAELEARDGNRETGAGDAVTNVTVARPEAPKSLADLLARSPAPEPGSPEHEPARLREMARRADELRGDGEPTAMEDALEEMGRQLDGPDGDPPNAPKLTEADHERDSPGTSREQAAPEKPAKARKRANGK